MDALALAQDLIRRPSVTPKDEGALAILEAALRPLGFICHRLRFEAQGTAPVDNLYARVGAGPPHFCFAGHTDVVPPGEPSLWRHDPFAAEIVDGTLYGRGAVDMKSAIAAFVEAAARHLASQPFQGTISLLITGDEEGPAVNGTAKVLEWLKSRGEKIDHCIVGEPTSTAVAGDTIKIGRRGSLTARIAVKGMQGHVGYPHKAKNPIPAMAALITRLSSQVLDDGTEHFEPSTLSFTTVDVGNPAGNVIPAEARAQLNIRFNDRQSHENLEAWICKEADAVAAQSGCEMALAFERGANVFLTEPGAFVSLIADAAEKAGGTKPVLSTTGGTSDARFIKAHCPVAELGLPGGTMHKADECVPVAEIHRLSAIYAEILRRYFAAAP